MVQLVHFLPFWVLATAWLWDQVVLWGNTFGQHFCDKTTERIKRAIVLIVVLRLFILVTMNRFWFECKNNLFWCFLGQRVKVWASYHCVSVLFMLAPLCAVGERTACGLYVPLILSKWRSRYILHKVKDYNVVNSSSSRRIFSL